MILHPVDINQRWRIIVFTLPVRAHRSSQTAKMCRPSGPESQAKPYAFDAVRDVAFQHAHALGGLQQVQISELMSFSAGRRHSVDSPSLPFFVRFNEPLRKRRQHYVFTSTYRHAATLDTEPLANSDSGGNRTRLSSSHFQSALALDCSAIILDLE